MAKKRHEWGSTMLHKAEFIFSMLVFLWVTPVTLGQNNMLLTTSGANFSFICSLWLIIGIYA
jgi:hypothetical protein